jgi:hypothetical protein
MRTGYLRERRHGRRTDGIREVHVFIAFLAYCLHVTLARRLHALAPRSVLEKFAAVQMIDLHCRPRTAASCRSTITPSPNPNSPCY